MESTDISGSGNGETTQFLNVTKLLNKEKVRYKEAYEWETNGNESIQKFAET